MMDEPTLPRAPPTVLIVDDDTSVSRALIRCLSSECDLLCTVASDALGAFDLLCECRFDLLITDMAMTGMSGTELLRIASERWPDMRRVLFTGYADASWVAEHQHRADAVIAKGGEIKPICKTICELASSPRPCGGGTCGAPEALPDGR